MILKIFQDDKEIKTINKKRLIPVIHYNPDNISTGIFFDYIKNSITRIINKKELSVSISDVSPELVKLICQRTNSFTLFYIYETKNRFFFLTDRNFTSENFSLKLRNSDQQKNFTYYEFLKERRNIAEILSGVQDIYCTCKNGEHSLKIGLYTDRFQSIENIKDINNIDDANKNINKDEIDTIGTSLDLFFDLELHLYRFNVNSLIENILRYGFYNFNFIRRISSSLLILPPFYTEISIFNILFLCLRSFQYFIKYLQSQKKTEKEFLNKNDSNSEILNYNINFYGKCYNFVKEFLQRENYIIKSQRIKEMIILESDFIYFVRIDPKIIGEILRMHIFHTFNSQFHYIVMKSCFPIEEKILQNENIEKINIENNSHFKNKNSNIKRKISVQRIFLKIIFEEFIKSQKLDKFEFFKSNNSIYLAELLRAVFHYGYGNVSANCFKELGTRFSGSFNLSEIENDLEILIKYLIEIFLTNSQKEFFENKEIIYENSNEMKKSDGNLKEMISFENLEKEIIESLNEKKFYKEGNSLKEILCEIRLGSQLEESNFIEREKEQFENPIFSSNDLKSFNNNNNKNEEELKNSIKNPKSFKTQNEQNNEKNPSQISGDQINSFEMKDNIKEFFKGKQSLIKQGKRVGFVDYFKEEEELTNKILNNKKIEEYENYLHIFINLKNFEINDKILSTEQKEEKEFKMRKLSFEEILIYIINIKNKFNISKKLFSEMMKYITFNGLAFDENGYFDSNCFCEIFGLEINERMKMTINFVVLSMVCLAFSTIRSDGNFKEKLLKNYIQKNSIFNEKFLKFKLTNFNHLINSLTIKELFSIFGITMTVIYAKKFILRIYLCYLTNYLIKPYIENKKISKEQLEEICSVPVFKNMPSWWEIGKHDSYLILGSLKHGLCDWEKVMNDKEIGWPSYKEKVKPKIETLTKRHKKLVLNFFKKMKYKINIPKMVIE